MTFQQIIMHVDVLLLICFDLELYLPVPKVMFDMDFLD